ncbi:MAG: hypothetical protein WCF46_04810, partial [Nitrososphaeraceae archaeon]
EDMIFNSVINIESVLPDLDIEYTTDSNDLSRNHKYVRKVASINKATSQDLTYCSSKDVKSAISSTSKARARVILCDNSLARLRLEEKNSKDSSVHHICGKS